MALENITWLEIRNLSLKNSRKQEQKSQAQSPFKCRGDCNSCMPMTLALATDILSLGARGCC